MCLGWFQSHSGPAGRDRGDRRDSGSAGGRRHRYFCCPVPGTRRTMVDGACGYSRVRGFVIFTSSIFLAENYVTNCCGAGFNIILFGTGAELYMRIRR